MLPYLHSEQSKNPQINILKKNGNSQISIKLQDDTYHNIERLAKEISLQFDTLVTVEQVIIDELTTIFRIQPHNSKLSARLTTNLMTDSML